MLTPEAFASYATALAALAGIPAALFGILQFIRYRTRRDKMALVSESFAKVVEALASEVEVERLAGAILLRRFFDRRSEFGVGRTPYAKEAVAVIASMLRTQPTGNLQKLLADGLAHAPTLVRADLQRTNLQKAYLGARILGPRAKQVVDLSYADFYRADLSGASLKEAQADAAVFYQARLNGTVLKGARLRNANFYEADLQGAVFDGADLRGATFAGARHVPAAVARHLDDAQTYHVLPRWWWRWLRWLTWRHWRTWWTARNAVVAAKPSHDGGKAEPPRIFVSRPGGGEGSNGAQVAALCARLEGEGFAPVMLGRSDYPVAGALAEAKRLIAGCAGAVILGVPDIRVAVGAWRPGTPEEAALTDKAFPTPWSQVEAGMAVMAGLPVLIVGDDGIGGGVFDPATSEHGLVRVRPDLASPHLADWSAAVRERARQAG
jgi:hypothetical protein